MNKLAVGFALAGLIMAAPAHAEGPNYSADAVVGFFLNSIDLGATRGICVGTPQECEAKAKPAGFDMLINFELDSADLTGVARDNLDQISRALKDDRLLSAHFDIEGYTDALGGEGYNMTLSQRRAAAVQDFLVSQGIDISRLNAVGFGEATPRVPDAFDPVNRRVEMRIRLQ